jgi:hypothetical protein
VFTLESFLENYILGTLFWAKFFHNESYVLILTKSLRDCFTKSSTSPWLRGVIVYAEDDYKCSLGEKGRVEIKKNKFGVYLKYLSTKLSQNEIVGKIMYAIFCVDPEILLVLISFINGTFKLVESCGSTHVRIMPLVHINTFDWYILCNN